MFSNKFIVIHFESMVAGNTKAVGNGFMKGISVVNITKSLTHIENLS